MGETVKLTLPRVMRDDPEATETACDGTGTIGPFDCYGCEECTKETDDEQ